MKFVFLLGGAAGFLTASGTDYFSGRSPDRILLDGTIGCLVGALLMRWFWNRLLSGVRETYLARQSAAAAALANPAPAASPAGLPRPPSPAVKPRL